MKTQIGSLCRLLILACLAAAVMVAGPVCGPGSHWVDTCPGGAYSLISVTTAAMLLDLDRNGSLETTIEFAQFTGITEVFLGAGSPHTMVTELYNLSETGPAGITLRAGDGLGNLINNGGGLYSPGRIEEQGGNPFLADSFFDVFFELTIPDVPGGAMVLRNQQAMTVTCLGLTGVAPRVCSYEAFNLPLSLFEGSTLRGQLLQTPVGFPHHLVTDTPEPVTWMLLGGGFLLLGRLRRRHAGYRKSTTA